MMRRNQIAAVIERDLLRADDGGKPNGAIECFSCGRSMTYNGTRFCSDRCRQWYDASNPGHAQDWSKRTNAPVRNGCIIRCAHCQQEFESIGLRCCSTECEQRHRERQDNLLLMAEIGIEPSAKRQCEWWFRHSEMAQWAAGFASDAVLLRPLLAQGQQTGRLNTSKVGAGCQTPGTTLFDIET